MDESTLSETGWIQMAPGVRRRTIASGASLMQMIVSLDSGSQLPDHRHSHEQATFILSGRLRVRLDDGGEQRDLAAGESIILPSNRVHGVEALEETVIIDTFNPPREDLLAQDRREAAVDAGTAAR